MVFYKQTQNEDLVQRVMMRTINGQTKMQDFYQGDRIESRKNMSLVVLVIPFDQETIHIREAFATVTKDVTSRGMALFVNRPINSKYVIIGISGEEEPSFILGSIRGTDEREGGFALVRVHLMEVIDHRAYPELRGLTPFSRKFPLEFNGKVPPSV